MMTINLRPENVKKSLDSLGRITLPKGLRDRMYLTEDNNELEIFTMETPDGRMFICLAPPEAAAGEEKAAIEWLENRGYKVTKEAANET